MHEINSDYLSNLWKSVTQFESFSLCAHSLFLSFLFHKSVEDWIGIYYECCVSSWYYKGMSRFQSETLIENDGREGCFMVRDSSQKGVYTLSIFSKASG